MKTVFDFKTYKDYLRSLLKQENSRGLLSKLAEAADCQRPYLSKVLQPDSGVHLTPDHMFGICEYLQLTDLEAEYLKLLLERDRASQAKYRSSLEARLTASKHQFAERMKKLGKEELPVTNESANFYYSYWLYAALHIAVSIPSLQTLPALAKRFATPETVLLFYLQKLEAMNLVKETKGKWIWNSGDLHLPKDAATILPLHLNWRNQAVQNVSMQKSDSLHYSLVQSLSEEDAKNLRALFSDVIVRFLKVATPSKPEELVCFNLDFFRVGSV